MARPGWRAIVGKNITGNPLLVGHQMARYQDAHHCRDGELAHYMGTTVAELPKLATHVIPEDSRAWAALHGLNAEQVGWVLHVEREKREQGIRRRMLSIRLQEGEHAAIGALSDKLYLNVTAVVERAIRELAAKHEVAL